jgi:hypothetical protein
MKTQMREMRATMEKLMVGVRETIMHVKLQSEDLKGRPVCNEDNKIGVRMHTGLI